MRSFRMCVFGGLVAVFSLIGCGSASDVKFDATDSATAAKSIKQMTAGMSDDQRKVFEGRASAVSLLVQAKAGSPSGSIATFWKGIHGLTKTEIEAKANELLPKKIEPTKQPGA